MPGDGQFWSVNNGQIERLSADSNWRSDWSHIVVGNFSGSGADDFLFYDPRGRVGSFWRSSDNFRQSDLILTHPGWRPTWTHIIPGNFSGSRFTDLLFYDSTNGQGDFYSTDGTGNMTLIRRHTGWRTTWTHIIPGNFSSSEFTDLLFYDAQAGQGDFYATNGAGEMALLRRHTGWRNTWAQIVPGKFGPTSVPPAEDFTDLLFYDPQAGDGVFYTTNGAGEVALLKQYTGWRNTWTQIVPGDFGLPHSPGSALLFYDALAGHGFFYKIDSQLEMSLIAQHTDWRSDWSHIVPCGATSGTLLFYTGNLPTVRLHVKILVQPNVGIPNMVRSMNEIFASVGVRVELLSYENLNIPGLNTVNLATSPGVQPCIGGLASAQQQALHANRNFAGANDVVAYFILAFNQAFGGCASVQAGSPQANIVVRNANRWVLAHEVGHNIGLNHPDPPPAPLLPERLMTRGAINPANPPPDVITSERQTMINNPFTV